MKMAQIILVKHNKIIKVTHKKFYKKLMYICAIGIVAFVSIFTLGGTNIRQVGNYMGYIYDPVNSLYSDNSSVVFTSSLMYSKDKLNFTLPIVGATSSVDNKGNIQLTVKNSIMVKSPESGVVEEIGATLNGIKYIKILHAINIHSVIENVDMIGVRVGETLKCGQDIATAGEGKVVVLKIFEDSTQITNLKINQSKIIWQK